MEHGTKRDIASSDGGRSLAPPCFDPAIHAAQKMQYHSAGPSLLSVVRPASPPNPASVDWSARSLPRASKSLWLLIRYQPPHPADPSASRVESYLARIPAFQPPVNACIRYAFVPANLVHPRRRVYLYRVNGENPHDAGRSLNGPRRIVPMPANHPCQICKAQVPPDWRRSPGFVGELLGPFGRSVLKSRIVSGDRRIVSVDRISEVSAQLERGHHEQVYYCKHSYATRER